MKRLTVERGGGYPSQSRLAAKVGMHASTLSLIESGRLKPTRMMQERLAAALGWEGDPAGLWDDVETSEATVDVSSVRPSVIGIDDLPAVATVREIAAFERVDERTIRKAIEAGTLPGAFRRGDRAVRIRTDVYLAATAQVGSPEATTLKSGTGTGDAVAACR